MVAHVLRNLHSQGTYDHHSPHIHMSSGLRGVGLAVVNALSEELEVKVYHQGTIYHQCYKQGVPAAPSVSAAPCDQTGTILRFKPDRAIFADQNFCRDLIIQKLEELVMLNPTLKIRFEGTLYHHPNGLRDYITRLTIEESCLHAQPIYCTGQHKKVLVEAAFQWTDRSDCHLRTFFSQYETIDGGTHEIGFWAGIRNGLSKGIPGLADFSIPVKKMQRGLVAVVQVGLYDPSFGAPTRDRLLNPEARDAVSHIVSEALQNKLMQEPELGKTLSSHLRLCINEHPK